MPKVKGIFFDLDGVLVDAVQLHYQCFSEAVRVVSGYTLNEALHRKFYCGLPTLKKLERLAFNQHISYDQIEAIYTEKQKLTLSRAHLYVAPNAVHIEMLDYLNNSGYILTCVSNCIRSSVEKLLTLAGLRDFFPITISNEDVNKPKPSADPYLLALEKCHLAPHNAIAFEDNENGIAAAQKAHIAVVETHYHQLDLQYITQILRNPPTLEIRG